MTSMADLFGTPVLPGLVSTEEFITSAEEWAATAAIDATDLSPFRFRGWTGTRLTSSYGWNYDFDAGRLQEAEPLPAWLLPLRDRAARFAGLSPDVLVRALLIRYDPGAVIGWHRDRPACGHVVGISLGAPAVMRVRGRRGERFERVSAPLPPRGAYHLSGDARHEREHSIAETDEARWSLSFRSLRGPAG